MEKFRRRRNNVKKVVIAMVCGERVRIEVSEFIIIVWLELLGSRE